MVLVGENGQDDALGGDSLSLATDLAHLGTREPCKKRGELRVSFRLPSLRGLPRVRALHRAGARVVEWARLESVCAGNSTEGSNPSLSAMLKVNELKISVRSICCGSAITASQAYNDIAPFHGCGGVNRLVQVRI